MAHVTLAAFENKDTRIKKGLVTSFTSPMFPTISTGSMVGMIIYKPAIISRR